MKCKSTKTISDLGFRIWDLGYGIWDMGFGGVGCRIIYF